MHEMSGATMRLSAATSGFVIFLLSASVIRAQNDRRVIYYPTWICALKGSTVTLRCSYTPPSRINDGNTTVERAFWFTKTPDQEPVDLRTDPEYAGRVQYSHHNNVCTLTITDLRESDSALYKFRFMMNRPDWRYTGEPGVTLLVTGFQVQIRKTSSCRAESCVWADLKCHSSCHPTHPTSFSWYENGVKMERVEESFHHYFYPAKSYSCAARGFEAFPSPSVCVTGQYCHRVTYADRSICAFKGSSVDISCTYSSHKYITSRFWFNPKRNQWWSPTRPVDLSKDFQYAGRVQVLEPERGRSTLRITDLRESDSAEYHFKVNTPSFDWMSSLPGTTLTVTDPDLQVQVIWSSAGPKLICHSSCPLSGRSSFVWYQNETKKILDETSPSYGGYVDPANNYSCAYQSYRSPPVYAPRVPLVLTSPCGDIMKGSSVNLTCSSDANPAANYTWYKEDEDSPKASGHIFIITNFRAEHSGNYSCEAQNTRGRHHSTVHLIVVAGFPKEWIVAAGEFTIILILVILIFVLLWKRKKRVPEQVPEPIVRPDEIAQNQPAEEENGLHTASVQFSNKQTDPLYPNILPSLDQRHRKEDDEDRVEYVTVVFRSGNKLPGNITCDTGEDPAALSSTVHKT